jgi:hypothetical protein
MHIWYILVMEFSGKYTPTEATPSMPADGASLSTQPEVGGIKALGEALPAQISDVQTSTEVPKFAVESHRSRPTDWEAVRPEVFALYTKIFGPIYEENPDLYESVETVIDIHKKMIDADVGHDDATTVLLREAAENKLVGVTYTVPARTDDYDDLAYFEDFGTVEGMDSWEKHQEMQAASLEVGITMVDPEYRGQGGWSLMMTELETRIAHQDQYTYLKRSVRSEDGYDQIVRAHSEGRIVHEHETYSIYDGEHILFWLQKPQI